MKDYERISVSYWRWVKWFVRPLVKAAVKLEISGLENIPVGGSSILVCNHMNNADPFAVAADCPRQIAWLTKQEWFEGPWIVRFVGSKFKDTGMIPINRENPTLATIREIKDRAQNHAVLLGVFPEEHRSKTGGLQEFQDGAAFLFLHTHIPILPGVVIGTEKVSIFKTLVALPLLTICRLFRLDLRPQIQVRFGKTFVPNVSQIKGVKEQRSAVTEQIIVAISELLPEKYHGHYSKRDQ